ncbi:MAG: glycerol-3-phosphate acyltransferase [Chloroflexi bacterium]|nr:glycerol-3-phosphate acyltransferase [Chloroflexota bacterium]
MEKTLLVAMLGYLLGSLPWAYIAGRLLKGIDIREVGDRNMGAANVYREVGHKAGIAVLLGDTGKGTVSILIAQVAMLPLPGVLLSGLAAVMGHNWPAFLGFRGGRGAATTLGVLLALIPQAVLLLVALAAVPFLLTRNIILASAILFAPLSLVAWWTGASSILVAYSIALPCLVGATHFLTTRHLPDDVRKKASYLP